MSQRRRGKSDNAPYAYEGLERVLHEKARLGILSSLLANPDGLVFTELKELCSLTDGNLSRHLQALQDARLIEIWKKQNGKRPQTLARMTAEGRERFLEYINLLEQIVQQTLHHAESNAAQAVQRGKPGWSTA